MILEHYYIECLSHASYLIGDEKTGRAIAVDPRRDKDTWVSVCPGVGRHVSSVMKSVPASERRTCDDDS
ncbi:MAG: baeB 2, partial [Mycobacterium sp.]|nr:baeB 2 [Mycobacterium sp.]